MNPGGPVLRKVLPLRNMLMTEAGLRVSIVPSWVKESGRNGKVPGGGRDGGKGDFLGNPWERGIPADVMVLRESGESEAQEVEFLDEGWGFQGAHLANETTLMSPSPREGLQ